MDVFSTQRLELVVKLYNYQVQLRTSTIPTEGWGRNRSDNGSDGDDIGLKEPIVSLVSRLACVSEQRSRSA
jgi:hypothetical protein